MLNDQHFPRAMPLFASAFHLATRIRTGLLAGSDRHRLCGGALWFLHVHSMWSLSSALYGAGQAESNEGGITAWPW